MLHPALLPFIVQSKAFLEHALATSAGSLSPRTKWKDLATFELDLPDSARQERIAQLLTQTENARLAWKAVIDRTTELRRGVARDTRRTPQWPKVPLRQVATVQNGTTPSRTRSDYWAGGTVPWLPTGKVHEREIWTADEHITTKALEQCSLRVVPAGSVLVAMIGQGKTRGAAAFLQTDATINQNFAAVTPAPDLNGRFLFHMLDASYDALRHASQGSSQGALNCRLVGDFLVPLPPREQQDDLARHFDAIGMALTRAEEQMQRTHELQRQLTESVLMDKHVH
jgi:type I restriction enzyme S subunit